MTKINGRRCGGAVLGICLLATAVAAQEGDENHGHTVQAEYVGCRNDESLVRFTAIMDSKDSVAARNFIIENLRSGECIMFEKGQLVYIDDWGTRYRGGALPSNICARLRGETTCYWTLAAILAPVFD
jgi:hypothetical protein